MTYLCQKNIPVNERLIFALDVPDSTQAKQMVNALGDSVSFYKIGLELFMAGDYFDLVAWLAAKGKKIFVDLKFYDVPQTVTSAVKQLKKYPGVSFVTVHAVDSVLEAVCKEKGALQILAVTVLTSLDQGDVDDLGFKADVHDIVLSRAKRALALGCDGVVSSGLEAPHLREHLGERFLVVTPGIRPVKNTDDQKRTVDIEEAFNGGASHIVVGRPIKNHEGFSNPKEAANAIQKRIATLFTEQV